MVGLTDKVPGADWSSALLLLLLLLLLPQKSEDTNRAPHFSRMTKQRPSKSFQPHVATCAFPCTWPVDSTDTYWGCAG
jgi:hypothetical protein